jgi:hypothetical protein
VKHIFSDISLLTILGQEWNNLGFDSDSSGAVSETKSEAQRQQLLYMPSLFITMELCGKNLRQFLDDLKSSESAVLPAKSWDHLESFDQEQLAKHELVDPPLKNQFIRGIGVLRQLADGLGYLYSSGNFKRSQKITHLKCLLILK